MDGTSCRYVSLIRGVRQKSKVGPLVSAEQIMQWFMVKSISGLFRSAHVTVISCRTSTGHAFGKVANEAGMLVITYRTLLRP